MRVFLRILAALLGCAVVLSALTARFFIWPSTDTPTRADAVIVLSGDPSTRLPRGLQLVSDGIAPVLVLSAGGRRANGDGLCGATSPARVLCPTPVTNNTRGEARTLGRLTRENGWRRIVVVTSTYHVTRARLLLGRCSGGAHLEMVGTAFPAHRHTFYWGLVAHEWGGYIYALTVGRTC